MKKSNLIVLMLLAAFTINARHSLGANAYEIKVQITGVKDSMCYLANYFGDKQYIQDSIAANANGQFTFKGEEKLPGGIYLIVMPEKRYFEVIVDEDQTFEMKTKYDDPINSMQVTGSDDNTEFYQYLRFVAQKGKEVEPLKVKYESSADENEKEKLKEQINVIDKEVIQYRQKYIAKSPDKLLSQLFKITMEVEIPEAPLNPDGSKDSTFAYKYYKEHFFDNMNLKDNRLVRTPVFHPKIEQYMTKLTPQIPDSIIVSADHIIGQLDPKSENFKYVIWWVTNHYETSKYMGMDAVFVHMAKNYYQPEIAYWVDEAQLFKIQDRAKVLEPILLGKQVKNLSLIDTSGVYQSLYNVKKPYTILYFWDPDCGHCKKVTPLVKQLYEKEKGRGVEVFAVCTEVEMDKWRAYIKENNLEWINVADPDLKNNFRYEFDITSTPQIFLLDKEKKIIAKKIEVETLENILEKELEKGKL